MTTGEEPTLGEIGRSVQRIEKSMTELREELKDDYITRNEFQPVKLIVYGLVALLLTGIVTAIVSAVIK